MKIRTDSTEYATSSITADHDLTGRAIQVSFPDKDTAPSTWYTAEVLDVTQITTAPPAWKATYRVLIGPAAGVVALPPGFYDWTVKLTDAPEVPVRKAGTFEVTAT